MCDDEKIVTNSPLFKSIKSMGFKLVTIVFISVANDIFKITDHVSRILNFSSTRAAAN